jgi:hypothetical protein
VEGPAIAHIYELLHRPERFTYVRFNFDHNYNQTSREAVYAWFDKWLLGRDNSGSVREKPFQKEPDSELRVFDKNEMPEGAMTMPQFLSSMRELHRKEWKSLLPKDKAGLKQYQTVMLPAWRHILQVNWPNLEPEIHTDKTVACGKFDVVPVTLTVPGQERRVLCTYWSAADKAASPSDKVVVLASANPMGRPEITTMPPASVVPYVNAGVSVLSIDRYGSAQTSDPFKDFYTTYNRTELQQRVRDLLMACSAARSISGSKQSSRRVTLVGAGRAGLYALLAAPAADAVVADCDALDLTQETNLLAPDLFCPGILTMGGFEGAAILAAPRPLLLHNTGSKFPTDSLQAAYAAAGVAGKLRMVDGQETDSEIAEKAAHF